jgi:hypothetical protein
VGQAAPLPGGDVAGDSGHEIRDLSFAAACSNNRDAGQRVSSLLLRRRLLPYALQTFTLDCTRGAYN